MTSKCCVLFFWFADLESYFTMQKYSQFASNKPNTQAAQNWAEFGLLPRVVVITTGSPWWALSSTFFGFLGAYFGPSLSWSRAYGWPPSGSPSSINIILSVCSNLLILGAWQSHTWAVNKLTMQVTGCFPNGFAFSFGKEVGLHQSERQSTVQNYMETTC